MMLIEDETEAGGLQAASAADAALRIGHTATNRKVAGFDSTTEGKWSGPFYFVQAADTQLGMIANFDADLANPSTSNDDDDLTAVEERTDVKIDWREEVRLMRDLIGKVNRMTPRPRFLIVCGDLIDAMPGIDYRREQTRDYKGYMVRNIQAVLSTLHPSIRPICVCGNHDIGNQPTPASIAEYTADFGDDYFTFWVGGCKFVVVNSQLHQDSTETPKEVIEMDAWLDEELNIASSSGTVVQNGQRTEQWKHLVGFQHVAPFLRSRDEPACSVFGDYRWCFNYAELPQRHAYLDRLKRAGMSKLFCGHWHRNAGGWDDGLEVIVTSAVGCQLSKADKSGVRIVRVFEKSIDHKYYSLDDLPAKVDLK